MKSIKKIANRSLLLMLFSVILYSCVNTNTDSVDKRVIGVKIYEKRSNYNELIKNWKTIGVNIALISEELLSEHKFTSLAKAEGIKLFLIAPIFYNPEALAQNNDLYAITDKNNKAIDDWVEFVCPSRENYLNDRIKYFNEKISKYKPDGISLDFIRNFVFWEMIYPERTAESIDKTCFCDSCMQKFVSETGVEIPENADNPQKKADWIFENSNETWVNWKTNSLTSIVAQIVSEIKTSNPDILVNLHAVPWRNSDFGGAIKSVAAQDFKSISQHVDCISPMCYSFMLKQEPQWINEVVEEISNNASCRVVPSIQVGAEYLDTEFSNAEFQACVNAALNNPSQGIIFWSWDALENEPEKLEIVQKILSVK